MYTCCPISCVTKFLWVTWILVHVPTVCVTGSNLAGNALDRFTTRSCKSQWQIVSEVKVNKNDWWILFLQQDVTNGKHSSDLRIKHQQLTSTMKESCGIKATNHGLISNYQDIKIGIQGKTGIIKGYRYDSIIGRWTEENNTEST